MGINKYYLLVVFLSGVQPLAAMSTKNVPYQPFHSEPENPENVLTILALPPELQTEIAERLIEQSDSLPSASKNIKSFLLCNRDLSSFFKDHKFMGRVAKKIVAQMPVSLGRTIEILKNDAAQQWYKEHLEQKWHEKRLEQKPSYLDKPLANQTIRTILQKCIAQDKEPEIVLRAAVTSANVSLVQDLLNVDIHKNPDNSNHAPALYIAAFYGHNSVIQHLLKAKADLNKARPDGATPLLIAAQKGHLLSVLQLLKDGADPDRAMENNVTPLLVTAQNGYDPVVKLLLQAGANPNNATKKCGSTPLHVAMLHGHRSIAKLLLQNGANPNKRKRLSCITPLMIALKKKDLESVELLLDSGAKPNFIERILVKVAQRIFAKRRG